MKYSLVLPLALITAWLCTNGTAQEQRRDRVQFVQPRNEFLDSIKAEIKKFKGKEEPGKKVLKVDFSQVDRPRSTDEFTRVWHTPPLSQGLTGTCWSFSATSYFESEIERLTGRQVKLSEMHTVYWEYVEKARRFVGERGNSAFGQGSEANALPRIWKLYGIVPLEAYTGLLPGQKFHDHDSLFAEMKDYLNSLKSSHAWDEESALSTIRSMLNHYMGKPPTRIVIDGVPMTPQEYLEKVLRLKLDDYVEILSLKEKPFYQRVEYEVGDNWWHSKNYFNVPLEVFLEVPKRAVKKGRTVCLGGDTSEPGLEGHQGIAIVPSFDIPYNYIDDDARQFRFGNKTTTDDHGIHLVGYTQFAGKDWYLIKDSGSGSRNWSVPGYYMYREDYVKLKMMTMTVHKDIVPDILAKFQR